VRERASVAVGLSKLGNEFDQKNGLSRSHRGTEMHENEIGTAIVEL